MPLNILICGTLVSEAALKYYIYQIKNQLSIFRLVLWSTHFLILLGVVLTTVVFFNLHSGGWNQGPLDTAAT
jgi:hypothetical protein